MYKFLGHERKNIFSKMVLLFTLADKRSAINRFWQIVDADKRNMVSNEVGYLIIV